MRRLPNCFFSSLCWWISYLLSAAIWSLFDSYFPLLLSGFNHWFACFSVSSCCPPFCPSIHLFILDPARRGAALHNPPLPANREWLQWRARQRISSDTFKNHLPSKPPMPAGVRKWAAWGRSRRTPPTGMHFVALRGFSQELGWLFSPPSASAQRGFRCSQHRCVRMWTDRQSWTILIHPPGTPPPPAFFSSFLWGIWSCVFFPFSLNCLPQKLWVGSTWGPTALAVGPEYSLCFEGRVVDPDSSAFSFHEAGMKSHLLSQLCP